MKCVGFAWKEVCRFGCGLLKYPKKEKQKIICRSETSCSTRHTTLQESNQTHPQKQNAAHQNNQNGKPTKTNLLPFGLFPFVLVAFLRLVEQLPHQTTKTRLKRLICRLPDRTQKKRLQIPSFRLQPLKLVLSFVVVLIDAQRC